MISIVNLRQPLLQVLAPLAPSRFTPWADAVIAVGRSLYGDEWGDAETAKAAYQSADHEGFVWSRLAKEYPELARRNFERKKWEAQWRSRSSHRSEAQKAQDEELGKALQGEIAAAREAMSAALPSFDDLKKENDGRAAKLAAAKAGLIDAVLNERLQAYWLPKRSPTLPVVLPLGPFMAALAGDGYQLKVMGMITHQTKPGHVFLDAAKLQSLFPATVQACDVAPTGADPEDLSAYLQLALYVAGLGYGARYEGEKKKIETQLADHAALFGLGDGELSPALTRSLATILRNKDAQQGKAGPLRGKKV